MNERQRSTAVAGKLITDYQLVVISEITRRLEAETSQLSLCFRSVAIRIRVGDEVRRNLTLAGLLVGDCRHRKSGDFLGESQQLTVVHFISLFMCETVARRIRYLARSRTYADYSVRDTYACVDNRLSTTR